jgi:hypothetical protein
MLILLFILFIYRDMSRCLIKYIYIYLSLLIWADTYRHKIKDRFSTTERETKQKREFNNSILI